MFSVRVKNVTKHSKDTVTVTFNVSFRSFPGQFVMLNLPGHEEIPLSLSSPDSVTVRAVGETTEALVNIQPGELLGIKGPMGRPFSIPNGTALLIAGGIGIAPLIYLHDYIIGRGGEVKILYGVRTSEELINHRRFENIKISTDNGSAGFHGNVIDLLKVEDRPDRYSRIYCCGPEIMLRKLYDFFKENKLLRKVEFALERYMKCGMGVCGSCALENGLMVCSEGPVFNGVELEW
jgi:dihydroorotate dehydrogenase electron transfer subunit